MVLKNLKMEIKEKCIKCGAEFLFKEKDIRKLTLEEKKLVKERNEKTQELLDEKEEVGFLKKRKVNKYNIRFIRDLIASRITEAYGVIKCPICGKEQFLIDNNEHKL